METPPDLIYYAIPGFVLLLTAEVLWARHKQADWYDTRDAATSLAMGIGNVITGLVSKLLVLGAFWLVWEIRLLDLGFAWWVWVLAFFADDFSYYWFHRMSHQIRYFWASHVVHHSSQKYNLATALRQTWTGNLSGSFIFWLWMPLLGFHPVIVVTMQAASLIYQFWIHTEAVGKLGPLEWVLNTPSHHRVHHSSELKYLDKNHAGVLIIWDRWFGTFQQEQNRPIYGLTKNLDTHNPVKVAFYEWAGIARDVRRAGSLKHAFFYLFGPPGWSHDGSRKTTRQLREEATARHRPPG
ncbi:MAG: sterol desaturase family protein [Cytophagaceae bacterium]|nr:sterol desaturase family protein [Cytophagaceae bacterium]